MVNRGESVKIKKMRIYAADDDEFTSSDYNPDETYDNVSDSLDDLSDSVDDMQESVDDAVVDEDPVDIEMDNNIANHYIAECESCHGVFISAMEETDQEIEKITGTCPLCDKPTDQYLKWIIKELEK